MNIDNEDNTYINLILKLYEQMEKSTDKIDIEITGLRTITSEMIDILKHSTTNEEIVKVIQKHSEGVKPTQTAIDNIFTKCENHGKDIIGINTHLKKLTTWVKNMILVVTIAFTLITTTYIFTKGSLEAMVKKEITEIHTVINSSEYKELKKMYENVIKDFKEFKTEHYKGVK